MSHQQSAQSNLFWEYSLALYAREGVAAACLALQDEFGLDVNLLLYGAWQASQGRRLDEQHMAELEESTALWRHEVVKPVRALRQRWREFPGVAQLRDELKSLELNAERQQQDMMWGHQLASPPLPEGADCLLENLTLAAAVTGATGEVLAAELRRLAAIISRQGQG